MTEPPEGAPSAHPLTDALTRAMADKAEARAPTSVRDAMRQFGWTNRDLAREMGMSDRSARRWSQQNRIPARRAEQWRDVTRREAARRQRRQIETRGLRGLDVTGEYRVSRSRYRARPDRPIRIGPARDRITGETMRGVFDALDRGDADAAEHQLNRALGDAYGAPVEMQTVDDLSYRVR